MPSGFYSYEGQDILSYPHRLLHELFEDDNFSEYLIIVFF